MSDGFWWLALGIATVSAAAHLVSMLGTRWGDRAASSKAFLFSLLAHVALFCGLFAVGPELERLSRERDEPQEIAVPLTVNEVIPDNTENSSELKAGELPRWDRPAEHDAAVNVRPERQIELPAPQELARTVEDLPPENRDIPTPNQPPESRIATPDTVAPLPDERLIESPETTLLPEETAEAREIETPLLARSDLSPTVGEVEGETIDRTQLPTPLPRAVDSSIDRELPMEPLPVGDELDLARLEAEPAPLRAESPAGSIPLTTDDAGDTRDEVKEPSPIRGIRRRSLDESFAETLPAEERADSQKEPLDGPPRGVALSSRERIGPARSDLPSISRPEAAPLQERRENGVPETYQLRTLDRRTEVARRNGGTEASEQAVELSLKWLAANQNPAGYWDADKYGSGQVEVDEEGINRQNAGKTADSGLTALALLAFLGAGYTQDEGEYAETVDKALTWLIENQREDGFLGGDAAHFEQMYCHGMATYALAEAYGMQADATNIRLRRPLFNAVLYIATQQGDDGGWRYVKGQAGDMSMFGWQLMALKSAEIAGIPMPGTTRSKMIRFLKDRSLGDNGGLAAYRVGLKPTAPMTAEALFCKQMLGMTRTNPASLEAVAYLLRSAPKRSELNYYYWYYGTLAMYQYGGTEWERWNQALRDLLIAEQVKTGDEAGSWAPKDAWGPYGGRVYSTAIATLSLEVYYRFLPLYRAGDTDDDRGPAASP